MTRRRRPGAARAGLNTAAAVGNQEPDDDRRRAAGVDLTRRRRPVQRVVVQARRAADRRASHSSVAICTPVARSATGSSLTRREPFGHLGRYRRAGQLGEALHLPQVRHRHDPRHYRDVAAGSSDPVDQQRSSHRPGRTAG